MVRVLESTARDPKGCVLVTGPRRGVSSNTMAEEEVWPEEPELRLLVGEESASVPVLEEWESKEHSDPEPLIQLAELLSDMACLSESRPEKLGTFTEYTYGGKMYAFTDHVGRMLQCPICQGVVKDAHSVRCCKKTFCKDCLGQALKFSRHCPLCRTAYPVTYENDAIDDGVNDLLVLCLHHGKGCEWSGHLLHEPRHREEKCEYEKVQCERMGCEVVGERRSMKQHMEEECVYREIPCEFCEEFQTVLVMKLHLLLCPEHPVECVNYCRMEGLLRKNIDSHLEVCPEAVVDCPFKEMGCSECHLKRKYMQFHTTNAVLYHLKLVMKNLVDMKQHCERALRQQEDAHQCETQDLKAHICQLQVEADAYKTESTSRFKRVQVEADAQRKETKSLKAYIDQLQEEADAQRRETKSLKNCIDKLQREADEYKADTIRRFKRMQVAMEADAHDQRREIKHLKVRINQLQLEPNAHVSKTEPQKSLFRRSHGSSVPRAPVHNEYFSPSSTCMKRLAGQK